MESKLTDHGKATILLKLRSASKLTWCLCSSGSLLVFLLALGFGLTVQLVHWKFGYLHGNLQNYSTITSTINDELDYMMRHSCAKSPLAKKYQIAYITTRRGRKEHVLCDTMTAGGNWIIIQRRVTGDVNFTTPTPEKYLYYGIGNHFNDFWKDLYTIMSFCNANTKCELRIDMEYKQQPTKVNKTTNNKYYAHYEQFWLTRGHNRRYTRKWRYSYVLNVNNFNGTAGDGLKPLNGAQFHGSTSYCKGAGPWWYESCSSNKTNLNGIWNGSGGKGVTWAPLTGDNKKSLSFVEMKVRLK